MITKNCAHDKIKPDEILRNHLVLAVREEKRRERLLRVNDLTSTKAIEICKASEQTSQQLKLITSGTEESVGAINTEPPPNTQRPPPPARMQILWISARKSPVPCQRANLPQVWAEEPLSIKVPINQSKGKCCGRST